MPQTARNLLPYGKNRSRSPRSQAARQVVSATTIVAPADVAATASNGVYIVDTNGNRVLHYSGTKTTADHVYGQASFSTTNSSLVGGG